MPHPLAALAALALAKKAAALAIIHAYGVGRLYRRALAHTRRLAGPVSTPRGAAAAARVGWAFRVPGRVLRACGWTPKARTTPPQPPPFAAGPVWSPRARPAPPLLSPRAPVRGGLGSAPRRQAPPAHARVVSVQALWRDGR